jgi:hypothetical protein
MAEPAVKSPLRWVWRGLWAVLGVLTLIVLAGASVL